MTNARNETEMAGTAAPRAFVSHATADQDRFVRDFANRLQASGVSTWYAEWALVAGDSLVERIFDQGIAGVDNFIVVLSEASVASNWVAAELDIGVVRRIEKKCRLIPLLIDDVAERWLAGAPGAVASSVRELAADGNPLAVAGQVGVATNRSGEAG